MINDKTNRELYEEIEVWLSGMDSEDREYLKNKLNNDPELMRQLLLYKDVNRFARELHEEERFSGLLKAIQDKKEKTGWEKDSGKAGKAVDFQSLPHPAFLERYIGSRKVKRNFLLRVGVSAAAAVFLLVVTLGLVFYFQSNQQTDTPERLFAAYYQPYQIDPAMRSDGYAEMEMLEKAFSAYNRGEFFLAARLFEKAYEELLPDKRTSLKFFAGVSYLEAEEEAMAKEALGEVIDQRWSIFYPEAKWYLALAYLKTGQVEKAKPLLEELKTEIPQYASKAEEILDRI